ncbi:MAG: tripartite tricarboxylate transporter substrate-binding protein [Hyphomicrobiaceae bacterium]
MTVLKRMGTLTAATGLAALVSLTGSANALAEDAAQFYKDKTVRFIVGVGVGGGFDQYARMLAPHIAKQLGATVVVENQPGAGGIIALNTMSVAQPDGLRFQIINGTPLLLGQLLGLKNIRYDLTKLEHLGAVSAEPWAALVSTKLPIKTPQDLVSYGKQISWGATGPTGGPSDGAAITCQALKLNCQIVTGFRGSAEIALAMERGEVDALYVTDASALNYAKNKQARPVGVGARKRSTLLPDVPTFYETLKLAPEQQWWLDLRTELNEFGRVLVTTTGVPADRLAYLRGAIKKVLTDPAVIAEGAKRRRYIEFREPAAVHNLAKKLLGTLDAKQKAEVNDVIMKKFYSK